MVLTNLGPVSPAAPGALYEQVVRAVRREVAAGRLKPGDALPSVRALAATLLVSVITIKRAYAELEQDGLIYIRQGLGAFIAEQAESELQKLEADAVGEALRQAVAAARKAGLSRDAVFAALFAEFEREDAK